MRWGLIGILFFFMLTGCAGVQKADRVDPVISRKVPARQRVVKTAHHFLGTPYRFGGTTPAEGFDCSGYVAYVFSRSVGLSLPRVTGAQIKKGRPVPGGQLLPADLVFFRISRWQPLHVGIYIGGNKFIHAPSGGGEVRVERLDHPYWKPRYRTARRLLPPFPEKASARPATFSFVDGVFIGP
ncbi:MAG: C40 family peptidase [Candidatus Manganitrophus sp.]|nr:MAG: C40 family peptidase [Candidatus Manganitrophus sp.]